MKPGRCRRCGSPRLKVEFRRSLDEVACFVLNGEWVALEHVPMAITCHDCGFELAGSGEEVTIDIEQGVITHAYVRTDKE